METVEIRVYKTDGKAVDMKLCFYDLRKSLLAICKGPLQIILNEEGLSKGKVIIANSGVRESEAPSNPWCEGLIGDFVVMNESDLMKEGVGAENCEGVIFAPTMFDTLKNNGGVL